MSTALTAYPSNAWSTRLGSSSCALLVSASGGAQGGAFTAASIGTATGWGELSFGLAPTWAAGGSIGAPSGRGAYLDARTLEGQLIIAGNWSGTVELLTSQSGKTVSCSLTLRFYKYNTTTTTYIAIGSIVLASQTISHTAASYAFASTSLAAMNFGTDDSLYIDLWANVSANTMNSSGLIQGEVSTSTTLGWSGSSVVTPGYVPTVALSTTLAGVGALTGTLSLATALTETFTGVGTLTGTLSIPGVALSAECDGVGTLAGTLSLATSLSTTLAGVGALSEVLSTNTALTSTLAGIGTLTGTIQLTTALSTTLAGVGTLSETFSFAAALTATLTGMGTLTGPLSAAISLPGTTFAGVGTLSGTVSLATTLANTLAGVGTLTGTLSTSANVALSVTLAGVGILSGTPNLSTALTTSMVGVGQLTETLSLSTTLAGVLAGSGTLDATISEQTSLITNMAGTGILTSTIMLSTSLASSFEGIGTLAGAFSMQVALFLNCVGISTLVGTMTAGVPGVPGTATALDQLIALSLLGNQLVVITGISDRFVANATLTDTLG